MSHFCVSKDIFQSGCFKITATCKSPSELEKLGSNLSNYLSKGDVLLLNGDVGAGKTVFSRGIIRSKMGDSEMLVTSPTYLLDNVYEVDEDEKIHHMDFYRLTDSCDFSILNIPEIFNSSLCLIEWPQRLGLNCPNTYLNVEIKIDENENRIVRMNAIGDHWVKKINSLLNVAGVIKEI